jgi:hypothetical protein
MQAMKENNKENMLAECERASGGAKSDRRSEFRQQIINDSWAATEAEAEEEEKPDEAEKGEGL